MNKKTLKIIDADRHVLEPEGIWEKYTDRDIFNRYPIRYVDDSYEKMIARAQQFGQDAVIKLSPEVFIGDIPLLNNWNTKEAIASAIKTQNIQSTIGAATLANTQIKSMDEVGITKAYMYPTLAYYIVGHAQVPTEVSLAYANAYNRWLYDYCSEFSDRLIPAAILSRHDPSTLTQQLKNIIEQGCACITLRPEVIAGKDFGHHEYDAFWSMCESHNIAIVFHGGTNLHAATAGTERFSSRFALHACSHPMEAQMAFLSLLESGVLEKHPSLKIAFLEAGTAWIPYWLWRLDNICYPEFPYLTNDTIKMLPSEYFKRHCWVSIEPGEPCLTEVIKMIGHKKLLFGSDFPHLDHLHLHTPSVFDELKPLLTEAQIEDILVNNAEDFFSSSFSLKTNTNNNTPPIFDTCSTE